jgi:hypothetical protein
VRQQQLMMRRISASNRLDKSKRQAFDGKQVVVFDAANLCFWPPWDAFAVLHQWILIDEAYYPERLFRMIIINCPSFFTTLWSIIKNWIDPATLLKIVIVGEDYHNCLTELIDKSEIPAEYGGSRDTFSWTFPSNYDYHVELNNEA